MLKSNAIASIWGILIISLSFISQAHGQSVEETVESLESAITELQGEVDNLEEYRYDSDIDLQEALSCVTKAKSTMRSVAVSLLLESIDNRKKDDHERVMKALKILLPEVFDRKTSKEKDKKQ